MLAIVGSTMSRFLLPQDSAEDVKTSVKRVD